MDPALCLILEPKQSGHLRRRYALGLVRGASGAVSSGSEGGPANEGGSGKLDTCPVDDGEDAGEEEGTSGGDDGGRGDCREGEDRGDVEECCCRVVSRRSCK